MNLEPVAALPEGVFTSPLSDVSDRAWTKNMKGATRCP